MRFLLESAEAQAARLKEEATKAKEEAQVNALKAKAQAAQAKKSHLTDVQRQVDEKRKKAAIDAAAARIARDLKKGAKPFDFLFSGPKEHRVGAPRTKLSDVVTRRQAAIEKANQDLRLKFKGKKKTQDLGVIRHSNAVVTDKNLQLASGSRERDAVQWVRQDMQAQPWNYIGSRTGLFAKTHNERVAKVRAARKPVETKHIDPAP